MPFIVKQREFSINRKHYLYNFAIMKNHFASSDQEPVRLNIWHWPNHFS